MEVDDVPALHNIRRLVDASHVARIRPAGLRSTDARRPRVSRRFGTCPKPTGWSGLVCTGVGEIGIPAERPLKKQGRPLPAHRAQLLEPDMGPVPSFGSQIARDGMKKQSSVRIAGLLAHTPPAEGAAQVPKDYLTPMGPRPTTAGCAAERNTSDVLRVLLRQDPEDTMRGGAVSPRSQELHERFGFPLPYTPQKVHQSHVEALNPLKFGVDVLQTPLSPPRQRPTLPDQLNTCLVPHVETAAERFPVRPYEPSQLDVDLSSADDAFDHVPRKQGVAIAQQRTFASHLQEDVCPMLDNTPPRPKRLLPSPEPDSITALS